jgi:hypothetical protein
VTRGSNLGPIRSSTSCLAGRVQRQDRIIVTLPASEITDGVAENLHLALRRYCESRLTLVQRETQVAWRQGFAHLAEDGRSPLSNPLQSRISAGVHRVRGDTRRTVPALLLDQPGSGRDISVAAGDIEPLAATHMTMVALLATTTMPAAKLHHRPRACRLPHRRPACQAPQADQPGRGNRPHVRDQQRAHGQELNVWTKIGP